MGSPLPPDPYAALGLSKDADSTAIKTAYRKLVLKTHPDKFPDPAQKAEKGAEFHKIQQAYEILGDDDKRERYDAQVRLAELRKEAMERQQARGAAKADTTRPSPAANYDIRTPSGTTYATRPTPRAYEESRTRPAYDDDDRYDEQPRVKSRSTKHQYVYSRGREESSSRRPSAFNIFVTTNNSSAKSRDQTKRRERTEKFVPVPVYNDSDSEERYRQEDRRRRESARQAAEDEDRKQREKEMFRRQAEQAARRDEELARERERERAARGRETSRRASSRRPDVDSYERKYMDQDLAAKEYMSKHHRGTSVPPDDAPVRSSTSRTKYAQVRPKEKSSSKRSASKEPWILSGFRHGHGSRDKSRKPTRSAEAEYDEDPRRPTLDKADSSPAALKQALRGEAQRSATVDSYDTRREREETQTPPKMRRAETMPATKVARQEEKSKANTSKLRTDVRTEVPRHMHDSGYSSPSTPSISDREKEKEGRTAAASRTTRTSYRYGADGGVAVSTDDDVYNTVTVEPTSSNERITRKPVSRSPIGERHPERDSDDSGRERMPSARTLPQEKTARYTYPVETETRRPHLSRATTQQVPSGRSPQKDVYERGRSRTYGSPDYARGQSHDDRGYERSSRSGAHYAEIPKHAGTPLRRDDIPAVRPGMRRGDSYTAQDVQFARKFTEADIRYAPPRGGRERGQYAFPNVEVPRPPMARGQTVM